MTCFLLSKSFRKTAKESEIPLLFGPGIWWTGLSLNRWGSEVQILQMPGPNT
ncbi:UNVERIFIED_ORG: hypothetical protein BCL66_108167 [Martelella mediterranea]